MLKCIFVLANSSHGSCVTVVLDRSMVVLILLILIFRCIRPNEMKSPGQFQADKVMVQLRYTGVLETTRIRREVRVM